MDKRYLFCAPLRNSAGTDTSNTWQKTAVLLPAVSEGSIRVYRQSRHEKRLVYCIWGKKI